MSKATRYLLLVGLCGLIQVTAVYAFNPNHDASLVGWWKMDETSGATAADSSGNGNNGTLMGGPTWATGHLKGALQFDGVDDYVDCGNSPTFAITQQVTLALWVNPQDIGNGQDNPWISRGDHAYCIKGYRSGNTVEFYIYDGGWYSAIPDVGAAFNNTWHHVAGTYDGSMLRTYIDGVPSTTMAHAGSIAATTYGVNIARNSEQTSRFAQAIIDDARIYNRALSEAEIAQVMNGAEEGPATDPSPANGAKDVPREVVLSWKPGPFGGTHDVYLGTSRDDVNNASATNPLGVLVSSGQDANTYDPPGRLEFGQTYYWRVDEVNPAADQTFFKGEIWQFTVEPFAYAVQTITATASSSAAGTDIQNTVNGLGLTGDLHGTVPATSWSSGNNPPQPVWVQYDFDKAYKLYQMLVWNYNVDFESLLGFGLKDVTIEYSSDGTNFTTLGDFVFAQADSAADYKYNTVVDFGGVAVKSVKITPHSTYGGKSYGLSEVRFLYIPASAREPNPAVGATGLTPDPTLSWRAGREAGSHNVYLGTDANALTLAGSVGDAAYAVSGLTLGTEYYWRVDEVNQAEAVTTWVGDVWNFTTNPFIIVDDMEAYTDTPGSQIFDIWLDGYGTLTNGSIVGNDQAAGGTYGETTIVHSGRQSMPLTYANGGSITSSEATRTFDPSQDWTKSLVTTLTLYFYGQATNTTTIPLWVKLTDQSNKSAKVTFGSAAGEDSLVLADPAWTTWSIPLSSFSGINLSRVKSMTIGLGDGAGSGKLFIDDIRLYPATTPAPTVTPTLVGWWKLDNDVKDSSGNNNNGTIGGAPTYVAAGRIGASMKFNGTTDYVDCGAGASLNITDQVTLAAWIKPTDVAATGQHDIVDKGDHAYSIRVSAGQVQFYFYYAAAWHEFDSPTYTSTFGTTWHHVAASYDGVQARVYVDGAIVKSGLYTGGIASATQSVSIGRNTESAGRLFNGEIDDVRIYRGALPTSEIKKLANP